MFLWSSTEQCLCPWTNIRSPISTSNARSTLLRGVVVVVCPPRSFCFTLKFHYHSYQIKKKIVSLFFLRELFPIGHPKGSLYLALILTVFADADECRLPSFDCYCTKHTPPPPLRARSHAASPFDYIRCPLPAAAALAEGENMPDCCHVNELPPPSAAAASKRYLIAVSTTSSQWWCVTRRHLYA